MSAATCVRCETRTGAGQILWFRITFTAEVRTRGRDHSTAEYLRLVAPEKQCPFCGGRVAICETRERYVQTLTKLLHVVGKGKKCVSGACGHEELRYRS